MVNIIVAPNHNLKTTKNNVNVFLAGGIQKCKEWQKEVIDYIKEHDYGDKITLLNPRRPNFPIHDPNAAEEQIKWEFDMIEKCDIFSMYFDGTKESEQPICFYELGRNIVRMQDRFPDDWFDRLIITCDKNFSRWQDVVIQTELATNGKVQVSLDKEKHNTLTEKHAEIILLRALMIGEKQK